MLFQLGVSAFASLWEEFLAVFNLLLTGIPGAFKSGFMQLLYEDPTAATLVISDFAKFGFGMGAVGVGTALALGLAKRFLRGRVR